jgi:hypothetical protein
MKGLVLAALSFALLMALSMALLRVYRGTKYFKMFLHAFALACAAYTGLHVLSPPDLGVLPATWLEPNGAVDFLNGLLVLALLFHSFWDVVYTVALTGFSGNLLVLLDHPGGLSRQEILGIHGAGEELDRVLAWRLPRLVGGGYVVLEGAGFRLRPKGWLIGSLTRVLKRILTAEEKGG